MTNQHKPLTRLAIAVVGCLPDSITKRREVLNAVVKVLPKGSVARGKIRLMLEQMDGLERARETFAKDLEGDAQ